MIENQGIELPEGNIGDAQDHYKYMGIPQADGEGGSVVGGLAMNPKVGGSSPLTEVCLGKIAPGCLASALVL